jgi:hypothetical protein
MIALDLSRLLSRAGRGTPTGIDRVELAYAEHLIATDPSACFAATTVLGGLGLVPRDRAEDFVAAIAGCSRHSGKVPRRRSICWSRITIWRNPRSWPG